MTALEPGVVSTQTVRVPAGPLLEHIADLGGFAAVASSRGIPNRSQERKRWERVCARARHHGYVSAQTADQISCRFLRVHPCMVWGAAWWDTDPDRTTGAAA